MPRKEDLKGVSEYKENKFMERVSLLVFIAIIIVVLLTINGCSSTVENFRDNDFIQGCKVTEAEAKLGYFNQEGKAVACKLKCSEKLPKNLYYKYDNNRTGCHVSIGQSNVNR